MQPDSFYFVLERPLETFMVEVLLVLKQKTRTDTTNVAQRTLSTETLVGSVLSTVIFLGLLSASSTRQQDMCFFLLQHMLLI